MSNNELIAKIKNEIERLNNKMDDRDPLAPNQKAGYLFALADVLSFLSTLESEKPVPNDLEEAAEDFGKRQELELRPFANKFFIAGSEWQKEQMMKEAVEADVNIYRDIVAGKSWAEFVVEMPVNNLGDRAKVIIVKED